MIPRRKPWRNAQSPNVFHKLSWAVCTAASNISALEISRGNCMWTSSEIIIELISNFCFFFPESCWMHQLWKSQRNSIKILKIPMNSCRESRAQEDFKFLEEFPNKCFLRKHFENLLEKLLKKYLKKTWKRFPWRAFGRILWLLGKTLGKKTGENSWRLSWKSVQMFALREKIKITAVNAPISSLYTR